MQNPTNFRQTAVHADGEGGILFRLVRMLLTLLSRTKKNITRMTREQDGLTNCLAIRLHLFQ